MKSNSAPVLVLKPGGTTPEQARDIRAGAWAFVFDCYAKKKATEQGNGKTKQKKLNTEEGGPHDLEANFS